MSVKTLKIIGILGALLTGVFTILSGDPVTGAGLIAASLGSANVVERKD